MIQLTIKPYKDLNRSKANLSRCIDNRIYRHCSNTTLTGRLLSNLSGSNSSDTKPLSKFIVIVKKLVSSFCRFLSANT